MFKFYNSIVPNKVRIGWHFSSNKYTYRDAYSALKSSLKLNFATLEHSKTLNARTASVEAVALMTAIIGPIDFFYWQANAG